MNYSKKRKIYIVFSGLALLTVMIAIFILSTQDGEESSVTSDFFTKLVATLIGHPVEESTIRTLAHFCEFAGLGFLMNNLIFSVKDKLKPVIGALLSWGYAWTDEIHQLFIPGRAFQLFDLTVDLGGIVLGTAVFSGIVLLIKRLKKIH